MTLKNRLGASLRKSLGQRYIIIGVSVYALELVIIVVARRLGASAVTAVSLSFWLGLVVSFALQKVVTFENKRLHRRVLLPQVMAFSLLVLFNFGFTVLATKLLASSMPTVLIRTLTLAITAIWNFYLYKTRIFKTNDEPVVY
jgi:putative flippase GtrA